MNAKRFPPIFVTLLLILATTFPVSVYAQSPHVLYAKPGGLTSGPCESWANACELEYALTSVTSGQEIWAAAGVYKPGSDRTATFQLVSGMGLYGGFSGTETARDERNWQIHITVLSGDVDNNDVNIDANFIAETVTDIQGENAYHVVTGSGMDNTAVLDGFTITAGQAKGDEIYNSFGGGMYNTRGSPTLANVTFAANSAVSGGGMSNYDSHPTLTNVTFLANSANFDGGGMLNYSSNPTLRTVTFSANLADYGGGMSNNGSNPILEDVIFHANKAYGFNGGGGMHNSSSSPILTNVTFSANEARWDGGGMYNTYSSPMLTDVTFFANRAMNGGGLFNAYFSNPTLMDVSFSANMADGGGGGMFIYVASPALTNVNFSANSAGGAGGGIWNDRGSQTALTNVTFFANEAGVGGGMYNSRSSPSLTNVTFSANSANEGGAIYNSLSGCLTLLNSILWGDNAVNGLEIVNDEHDCTSTIIYSNVQGGWLGTGNIDAYPFFVDSANGDLHLQAGSPAIDSGTNEGCPSSDYDGAFRPQDGNNDGTTNCDMGAFEFVTTVLPIRIDIKPGSETNPLNLTSRGVIPVAVLTTAEFDASELDPATVLFAGASSVQWIQTDIESDGDLDLLFHFKTTRLNLTGTSEEAWLTGSTYDDISVKGSDRIMMVPAQ